jgi:protease-4
MAFRDYLFILREAKDDPNLSAVIFQIRDPNIGWSRAWELREIIKELRQAGLATTAFLESADNLSYYIASVCDEIFLVPSGQVRIRGLTGEVIFFKKTLDKLGIKAEMSHVGKYKSAHEMFTRAGMSPAHREEVDDILDNMYDSWLGEISRDRHIGEKEMKSLVDRGNFSASEAKEVGLVDRLCYEDEIKGIYEERLFKRPRRASLTRYASYRAIDFPLGMHFKTKPRIALIYATGPITSGSSSDFSPTGRSTGADSIAESLRMIREDDDVAGVLVRVNSPGGSALASDLIWREMNLSATGDKSADDRNKKPLIVSMGDVAASGGYYISSSAHKILAGPSTITGSIGVIGGKFNLGGLAEMVGVNIETVSRGKIADMESPFRSYTPVEKKKIQNEVKDVYNDFINRVSTGRAISQKQVEKVAQGRVWLGTQAMERGLVDGLGGFLVAIDELKRSAGIPLTEKVLLDIYPKKKRVIRLPLRGLNSSERARKYFTETLVALLPTEIRELLPLWREDGPLAIMTYFLRIR